ncbi:TPA: formate acetyltransferase [bacterium]|nr:formate acetyltransferase [bacterium]
MKVTFDDLSLKHITIDSIPRLKKLREIHFKTKPEICVEIPRLLTEFMKKEGIKPEHGISKVMSARRFKYILENKKAIIDDLNLLAGSTTTKIKGVPIYPQFMGQAIWPELETIHRRKKNPFGITKEEIDELNLNVFPYWMDGTVQEVCRSDYNNPRSLQIMERIVFFIASKVHVISHTIPDYEIVVKEGLGFLLKKIEKKEGEFYEAVRLVIEGVIAYANNLSKEAELRAQKTDDKERREELLKISKICKKVPKESSETLQEALQAIWICNIALHQEHTNIALSLGRLDQILYPFYKGITPREAIEQIGCFFLKLADHVPMNPETGEELFGGSGSNQAVTIGGITKDGNDASNDMTYLILKTIELLRVRDPNLNIRYHPDKNSKEYLKRLCEVNINTRATPCFHNDIPVIEALRNQGYSENDANDYSIVGCVEPVAGGRTFGHSGAILLNLAACLDMALFCGKHRLTEDEQIGPETTLPKDVKSFDEFLDVFKIQTRFLIDQSVEINNLLGKAHFKINPLPFLSVLTDGCIERGRDVLEGGARYNSSGVAIIGLSEVIDSLCAIKEFVFEKKGVSFEGLIDAIKKDWQGYEVLRQKIMNSRDKFGTQSELAKKITDNVLDFLHTEYQKRENYRGGKYTVGYWTMTMHAGLGVLTGALPSGRENKEVLPSGITPVSGSAPELLDVLSFMAKLDKRKIANGHALNLKFTPGENLLDNFIATIDAYFKIGGMQVQCNIIDRNTLIDMKNNPEKYDSLLVRVSGYTAYFQDLNIFMQDEIIKRAEYDLRRKE